MEYSAVKTTEKLFPFLDSAVQQFGSSQIWWRGQANSCKEWPLLPSVYRRQDGNIIEQDFLNQFRRRALSRHKDCPFPFDNPGWLFLMQHYRLPTRLLDWSESFLVATYFAVTAEKNKPGALWALSPFNLNEDQLNKKCIFGPDGKTMQPFFKSAFMKEEKCLPKVAAIHSKEIDPRVMTQLSVFTIHENREPLESLANHKKFLMKFEIPSELKKHVQQLLWDLGIRESNIFPDLEHLAKEMVSGEYKLA